MSTNSHNKDAFVTWNDEDSKNEALAAYSNAVVDSLQISKGSHSFQFKDITSQLSSRDPFTRKHYERFRPNEAIPKKPLEIIDACMSAYQRVGLIRNIIDLMGDFACQGVTITHPNKKIERFFNNWFKKVDGKDRSERFLNLFYRTGNVIIKRGTAKILKKGIEELQKTTATPDHEMDKPIKMDSKEIPIRYTFINPLMLEVVAEELSLFSGKKTYRLKINSKLSQIIRNNKSPEVVKMIGGISKEILKEIRAGRTRTIPLNMDKIVSFFYKKDDWQVWAHPMTYAILDDLILLEKLKLADLAAADGAMSHVRLWKLGSLEEKILPQAAAVENLAGILANNVGGGSIDLIWGPDIELVETTTDVSFLGSEKYAPVLNSIYAGLGIPPTLTGSASSSGFTNNFISLKTMIERLEYGRTTLKKFWQDELELVRRAMGFRFPAQIQFSRMTLSDETAEKALLVQLLDRNLISIDTVLQRFGEIPELEKLRMKRESRDRKNEALPSQAGPWHSPEKDHDLAKIALQKGVVTPSEVGLELLPRKKGEKTAQELITEMRKISSPGGQPQQGRPKNSKDSSQRKQKTVKPRTSASDYYNALFWAKDAHRTISTIITPAWLDMNKKKDLRSLTTEEFEEMEQIKFAVLCSFDLYSTIDPEKVYKVLPDAKVPSLANECYQAVYQSYISDVNQKPTIDDIREIQNAAYALYKSIGDEDVES